MAKAQGVDFKLFQGKKEVFIRGCRGFKREGKIRKSYGFKSWRAMEIALYHNLGNLSNNP